MSDPDGLSACLVEVQCEDGEWATTLPEAEHICSRAALAAFVAEGAPLLTQAGEPVEISILLTDDEQIAELNHDYRGKDGATNVLSFPALDRQPADQLLPGSLLGDIVLARQTVQAEAAAKGVTVAAHASHLVVHGVLHLLGHDHLDDGAAEVMEKLETKILATMGIADPWA